MNGTDPSIFGVLINCELFATLSEEEINSIVELARIEKYEQGDTIFAQGDRGNELYIVKEGQVLLERTISLGKRKATTTIAVLGRGRAFGCASSLLGESHDIMTDAVCTKNTEVVVINGTALRNILRTNTHTGFLVLERFAYILRERLSGTYEAMEKIV